MDGWVWMIWWGAWIGAVAASVVGLLLVGWAVKGRRREGLAWGLPESGGVEGEALEAACCGATGECDCCGYELAGLEHGYCPECGWAYVGTRRWTWGRRRRRARGVIAGLGLVGAAGALLVMPRMAEHGWMAGVPGAGLVAALPHMGDADSAVHRQLTERLNGDRLRGWERRLLAGRCVRVLEGDAPEPVREAAAGLLAKTGDAAAGHAGRLLPLLDDPSARVRGCVVEALVAAALSECAEAGAGRAAVVRGLMSAAARDASEPVRRRAVDGLGRLGPGTPGLTEVFVRAMGDPSPKVRVRALYAVYGRVVRGGGREAAAGASLVAVEAAARDQNEGVREAAVFALGKLAETIDRAVVAMGAVLRDGTPEMRRVAARNLCALGPRAAPAWVELMMGLEDEDSQVQEAVVEALRGLGRS